MLHRTENIIFVIFTLVILLTYARLIFKYPGTIEYLGLFSSQKKKRQESRKGLWFMAALTIAWVVGFTIWISRPAVPNCTDYIDKTSKTILWKDCQ